MSRPGSRSGEPGVLRSWYDSQIFFSLHALSLVGFGRAPMWYLRVERIPLSLIPAGMSDQTLATLSTDSSNIRELTLEGCYRLSDNGIEAMLKNLNKLETLDLSSCTRITSKTVRNIVRYAGNTMLVLRLRTAAQLSGEDFLPIAELKHLERYARPEIGSLVNFLVEQKRLTAGASRPCSLCISENRRVDDGSLIRIISEAGSKLQSLNMAGCTELTDKLVSAVAECCPHLEVGHISL
mmetsp:Transcript_30647/g.117214  ORF Transcript_30647/g.117214 Transcript_30647/m.117214 type:complete len:238 (+) Transcript_30647:1043-1756(+)